MDEIKIIWTKTAIQQRGKIFEYWNNRNKSDHFSKKLNLIIYKKLDLLKLNPNLGVETEWENYRIIHFGNYSLVYKIEMPLIHIVSCWDNRQNPGKLKKLLGL